MVGIISSLVGIPKPGEGEGKMSPPHSQPHPRFHRPCGLPLFFGGLRVCDAKSAKESMRVDLSAIVCRMCTSAAAAATLLSISSLL